MALRNQRDLKKKKRQASRLRGIYPPSIYIQTVKSDDCIIYSLLTKYCTIKYTYKLDTKHCMCVLFIFKVIFLFHSNTQLNWWTRGIVLSFASFYDWSSSFSSLGSAVVKNTHNLTVANQRGKDRSPEVKLSMQREVFTMADRRVW